MKKQIRFYFILFYVGTLKLCKSRGQLFGQSSPWNGNLWILNPERSKLLQPIRDFKSTSGHKLYVRQLCFEHGHFVNKNWDSKHENSEEWVCDQCKHGLGYGVFESDQNIKDKLPLSWMVACKGYVFKYVLETDNQNLRQC